MPEPKMSLVRRMAVPVNACRSQSEREQSRYKFFYQLYRFERRVKEEWMRARGAEPLQHIQKLLLKSRIIE